jgi:hypothetical protein
MTQDSVEKIPSCMRPLRARDVPEYLECHGYAIRSFLPHIYTHKIKCDVLTLFERFARRVYATKGIGGARPL